MRVPRLRPPTSHDRWHNAAAMACAAMASYRSEEEVMQASEWPHTVCFKYQSARGVAFWDDEDLLVSIAGTNDGADVVLDGLALHQSVESPYDDDLTKLNIRAHMGVVQYNTSVQVALERLTIPKGLRFRTTGHSLGAGPALLLPITWRPTVDVATFGALRVFEPFSAGRYPFTGTRFVRRGDSVPELPPRRWGGRDFSHVLDTRLIEKCGSLSGRRRDASDKAFRLWCYLEALTFQGSKGFKRAVAHGHSCEEYAKNLEPFLKVDP